LAHFALASVSIDVYGYDNGNSDPVRVLVLFMRAQLIPLEGGPPVDLVKDLTIVGRKEDCDLRLDHKSISKQHCVIVKTDGLLLIRDLGSTNGTRVNGSRVRRAALLSNDQLSVASVRFRVHLGEGDAPPVPGDFTMHMDAEDVAALLHKKPSREPDDSSGEMPAVPVKNNQLPDVYPDDKKH
jgi:pSer/pThr/pTyr-binding forkhead associated (FHA) protein